LMPPGFSTFLSMLTNYQNFTVTDGLGNLGYRCGREVCLLKQISFCVRHGI